ncbi:RNA polymerase sigma factor [Rubrivirga sp. IMCC43871]|uniref:RNA polymerase sigma factor n=1 Tax=Rubrivirga sp. IMCC43871 TaxID=3391575 RepID=UPI00398FCC31
MRRDAHPDGDRTPAPCADLDALAARGRAGDAEAEVALWTCTQPRLDRLAVDVARGAGLVGREEDARDVARRSYEDARADHDPGKGPFWPFIKRRATSRLIRWITRERRHEGPPPIPPPGGGPDASERLEAWDVLVQVLSSFEDPVVRNKWMVIRLCQEEGYSVREVADSLVGAGAVDPALEATWPSIVAWHGAARWPVRPPPLPVTWAGCAELFRSGVSASGRVVPGPPAAEDLADPARRSGTLDAWAARLHRFYYRAGPPVTR